jgi:hypothetical protein
MITEKEYLEAQKIVDKYKSQQLNKPAVSGSDIRYCICNTECLGCYHKDVKCKKLRGHYR